MPNILDTFFWGVFRPDLWVYALVALALTHVTIAAVTIFLHRCQAHRSLELHPVMSHFFRFWLWLTTGMVTKEWAAVHRKHHAKAETAEDPHSPQVHGLASVLWGGVIHYARAKNDPETLSRYGYGTPDDWMEHNVYKRSRLGVTLMALINVGLFGLVPGMALWAVQMVWIPFWAAGVINGVGHYWGYRNFQPQDESRNIVPLGLVIGGEELHNNHHAFPTSARLSNRWYEFDIGWLYIRLMEKTGLAKVKRVAPVLLSADSRAACDLDTLQSVIANRLEVVSRFAASLKKTCNEELRALPSKAAAVAPTAKTINNWLCGMERRLSVFDKKAIGDLVAQNKTFATIGEMRERLVSLWEDRAAAPERSVERLRKWCADAEQSGIAALAAFAMELRGYRTA
jgi:stearoyl-CoA desaturase (delta-9 desaturase)